MRTDGQRVETAYDGGRASGANPTPALLDALATVVTGHAVVSTVPRLLSAACEATGASGARLTLLDHDVIEDTGFGDGVAGAATGSLSLPVRVHGKPIGTLDLACGARPFTALDQASAQVLADTAAFVIHTARTQGRDERRRRWLEASAWLTEALRPPVELGVALQLIHHVARSISGAVATALVQWSPDAEPAVTTIGDHRVTRHGFMEMIMTTARPPTADAVVRLRTPLGVVLVLPLRSQVAIRADLVFLLDPNQGGPESDETELLESLADQASLLLDRLQAAADRVDLDDVTGRDDTPGDVYDTVVQRLFALGLRLQAVRAKVRDQPTVAEIDRAIDGLDVTISHLRDAIRPATAPTQSESELEGPSNLEASTAAWVRRSSPSLPRMLDT